MRIVNKPNLNGPRFRGKRKSVLTVDTLNMFKKKHPQYEDLSLQEFKDIIMTFNTKITEGIVEHRNGIELPEGLGFIFMGSCPMPKNKKNIDYKRSIEYGVEANFRNWDSDNKLLKIFYTNHTTKYPFKNKQVWAFKAVKEFRSTASKAFKNNWTKYIEVSPTVKISGMFDRHRKKEYLKNLKPIIPEGYDEFKI